MSEFQQTENKLGLSRNPRNPTWRALGGSWGHSGWVQVPHSDQPWVSPVYPDPPNPKIDFFFPSIFFFFFFLSFYTFGSLISFLLAWVNIWVNKCAIFTKNCPLIYLPKTQPNPDVQVQVSGISCHLYRAGLLVRSKPNLTQPVLIPRKNTLSTSRNLIFINQHYKFLARYNLKCQDGENIYSCWKGLYYWHSISIMWDATPQHLMRAIWGEQNNPPFWATW